MGQSFVEPVIFSYGMRQSQRPSLGRSGCVWAGGRGTWYAWSVLLGWERWPRRQDAHTQVAVADAGKLLLFVSHRWESLEHPDPNGAQLLCLKVGLTLALAAAVLHLGNPDEEAEKTHSGLPEVIAEFLGSTLASHEIAALQPWASKIMTIANEEKEEESLLAATRQLETGEVQALLDRLRSLILVWYDYASMFQVPRNSSQETAFRSEILELNRIQSHACTLVIAGDNQYVTRAWCFLELCGGMRQRITEITPSWGKPVGVGASVTSWASRSDQFIGALKALGHKAIERSALQATHAEDLPSIARLLSELPLTGLIETDDSDLVGGALPIPFHAGEWKLPEGTAETVVTHEYTVSPIKDFGQLPAAETLSHVAEQLMSTDSLGGTVGVWVYTTQRVLTLAWAARSNEFWKMLKKELIPRADSADLKEVLHDTKEPSVTCLWADARSLADDGLGWTRVIPSAVNALVIITQVDVPELCRIYEWIVRAHLACGIPVITYAPETGRTLVYLQSGNNPLRAVSRRADVIAVPRMRRADAYPNRLFMVPDTATEDIEVLTSLRLDPAQGLVGPGQLSPEAADAGLGKAGDEITTSLLLGHSEARVRAEGLARRTAASWDDWCTPRLHQSAWQVGMAPVQVRLIEQLVHKSLTVSDNPLERRRFLNLLVEDHKGYALPPSILDDAEVFIKMINEQKNKASD